MFPGSVSRITSTRYPRGRNGRADTHETDPREHTCGMADSDRLRCGQHGGRGDGRTEHRSGRHRRRHRRRLERDDVDRRRLHVSPCGTSTSGRRHRRPVRSARGPDRRSRHFCRRLAAGDLDHQSHPVDLHPNPGRRRCGAHHAHHAVADHLRRAHGQAQYRREHLGCGGRCGSDRGILRHRCAARILLVALDFHHLRGIGPRDRSAVPDDRNLPRQQPRTLRLRRYRPLGPRRDRNRLRSSRSTAPGLG